MNYNWNRSCLLITDLCLIVITHLPIITLPGCLLPCRLQNHSILRRVISSNKITHCPNRYSRVLPLIFPNFPHFLFLFLSNASLPVWCQTFRRSLNANVSEKLPIVSSVEKVYRVLRWPLHVSWLFSTHSQLRCYNSKLSNKIIMNIKNQPHTGAMFGRETYSIQVLQRQTNWK